VSWPHVAIVAPSLDIFGGQGVQARILAERLADDGRRVCFVPINPSFPAAWSGRAAFPICGPLSTSVSTCRD
jgi:hypothetical protein